MQSITISLIQRHHIAPTAHYFYPVFVLFLCFCQFSTLHKGTMKANMQGLIRVLPGDTEVASDQTTNHLPSDQSTNKPL